MTADLLDVPLPTLLAQARQIRDDAHGRRVTYSPKVFIPLTMLCRDKCGYCTFAQPPARLESPYLTPDEVLAHRPRRRGRRLPRGAVHARASGPSCATRSRAEWLAEHGYASTVDYLAAMAQLVLDETGLLPHANAGALYPDELAALRAGRAEPGDDARVAATPTSTATAARPDKTPERRLATLEAAGELADPVHDRHPRRHRRDPRRPHRRARGDRRVASRGTATCKR